MRPCASLQVAIHAIGDRANDDVVDMYTRLLGSTADAHTAARDSEQQQQQPGGERSAPLRHRVEHGQHLSGPGVVQSMSSAGLHVVTNPLHLLSDTRMMPQRLGAERSGAGRSYAFRTLQQAGVAQAFGSDWPVVPMDAVGGMYAAVARRHPEQGPEAAWAPSEKLSGEEALYAHTLWAAEASLLDGEVGSLRVGLRADFVVLDANPVLVEEGSSLPNIVATFMDGKCGYGCDRVPVDAPTSSNA